LTGVPRAGGGQPPPSTARNPDAVDRWRSGCSSNSVASAVASNAASARSQASTAATATVFGGRYEACADAIIGAAAGS
jgi:hypothetical protein